MKIKLDENIPGAVAELMRAREFDVDTVLERSLGGQSDPDVLAAASTEGRLLVTLDRGFGDVRSYAPGSHPWIIVLRPEDQRVPSVVAMVETLLDHHDLSSLAGLHRSYSTQLGASSAARIVTVMTSEYTATLRTTRRFTIDELAAAQGVVPMVSTEEWAGDIFDSDEELDDFLEFVREWRSRSLA